MECPFCKGDGELEVDRVEYDVIMYDCDYCKGKGRVSFWMWLKCKWFGWDK